MSSRFPVAPMSTVAWVWTIGFVLVLVFFALRVVLALSSQSAPDTFDLGATVLLVVIFIYGLVRSVRAYSFAEGSLVVERTGPGKVLIAADNISSVEANSDLGSFFNISILSIGGLFGWAGRARVRKPTDAQSLEAVVYGTNPAKSVVLQLATGRTVIVTPTDPQAFVAAVQDVCGLNRQGGAGESRRKRR